MVLTAIRKQLAYRGFWPMDIRFSFELEEGSGYQFIEQEDLGVCLPSTPSMPSAAVLSQRDQIGKTTTRSQLQYKPRRIKAESRNAIEDGGKPQQLE
jgi:hypothetical protein